MSKEWATMALRPTWPASVGMRVRSSLREEDLEGTIVEYQERFGVGGGAFFLVRWDRAVGNLFLNQEWCQLATLRMTAEDAAKREEELEAREKTLKIKKPHPD